MDVRDTDANWEALGRADPYWAVITDERFRRGRLDEEARRRFFHLGEHDADVLGETFHKFVDPAFAPRSCLDFGCGVGRTVVAFARRFGHVTGVDISTAMLEEAVRNCEAFGLSNVAFRLTDAFLADTETTYDLVHSNIVLQHIPPERGMDLLRALVGRIRYGGYGAIQLTYEASAAGHAEQRHHRSGNRSEHGTMIMSLYDLNAVLRVLQDHGCCRLHTRFSVHGEYRGVFLHFRREAVAGGLRHDDGWRLTDWFSYIRTEDYPRVEHFTLGMLQVRPDGDNPAAHYFHKEGLGEFWTSPDHYPRLFLTGPRKWIVYEKDSKDPCLFRDEDSGEILEV